MIRVLPADVVNQIAAGEVIERPFSIVKELVENSLDAGGQRIHVEISDGGKTLIRVTDDGGGFTADDLELAFVGHATSKLEQAADLACIGSLGFRGEALASIGSVSRARILSRVKAVAEGFSIQCDGGDVGEVRPCGTPPGTVVEVRDIFYNTPARRHFLKTTRAEKARIQDMLVRLALARLDVDFTFVADGRQALRLPADETLKARVRRVYGEDIASNLMEVDREIGDYRVVGLVADPDVARRDTTMELLYVNGRCARDRASSHSVRQAYRDYLIHGRFPIYFLALTLPPAQVDVNVHPTKAELRFLNGRKACGLLHDAVKSALGDRGLAVSTGSASALRPRSGFPDLPADLFGRQRQPISTGSTGPGSVRAVPEVGQSDEVAVPHPFRDLGAGRVLQVRDLYIVVEGTDGLVIIDQHALHERVLYEKLRHRDHDREVKIQRLLSPVVVEATASDKAWLLEAAEVLAKEGFLVEDFGGSAVAIQGIPALLSRARPEKIVEALTEGGGSDPLPRARDAIADRFHSMACRSSVMSGDQLSDAEIVSLLEEAASLEHPHNCPHGRPTVISFGWGELEGFFQRRV